MHRFGNNGHRGWRWLGVVACVLCLAGHSWAAQSVWQQVIVPWVKFGGPRVTKAAGSATDAIKALDDMLNDYRTGPNLSADDKEHNRRLKKRILSGTFDVRELCRISLGEHWAVRTPQERDSLVELMTSLMEEKAVTSKEQTAQKSKSSQVYHVQYVGEKFLDPQKTRAVVLTKVTIPSEKLTIRIDYKLQNVSAWKIYDVVVDDSSLVDNYAYQFDSIITESGYEELVRKMQRKLEEIRAEKS